MEWQALHQRNPKTVEKAARASMKIHIAAMMDFWNMGVLKLDCGNNIRQMALVEGFKTAFDFPPFVPTCLCPFFVVL